MAFGGLRRAEEEGKGEGLLDLMAGYHANQGSNGKGERERETAREKEMYMEPAGALRFSQFGSGGEVLSDSGEKTFFRGPWKEQRVHEIFHRVGMGKRRIINF